MKKALSLLLSLVMLLSVTAGISFNAQAAKGLASKTVTISVGNGSDTFEFTPTKTADYYFWSESDGDDTIATRLYRKDTGAYLSKDTYYDDGYDWDFQYYCHLEKGVTYVLVCKFYDHSQTGSYPVYVDYNPVKSVTFTPAKAKQFTEFTTGEYIDEDTFIYFYDWEELFFDAGDKITITMNDGTKRVFTAVLEKEENTTWTEVYFRDSNGVELGMIWYETDQNVYYDEEAGSYAPTPWKCGTHYAVFSIAGKTVKVPVEIVPKGWYKVGTKWHFSKDGADAKGWVKASGKWYYLNTKGEMVNYWQKISGKWYYFNSSGAMVTGWLKISGKWYYFNASGAMATGWQKVGSKWYYFNAGGDMKTGWLKSGGKWYYLDDSGAMVAGKSLKIGKKTYKFNSSGVCTNP